MARSNYGAGNWAENGPRALAWMRERVPLRTTIKGLPDECAGALNLPVNGRRLVDWLGDGGRAEWTKIKRTLGSGTGPHVLTGASAQKSSPVPCSLDEYAAEERRATCPVCALPAAVRAVLATAGDKGHKVAFQVKWLKVKCRIPNIGVAELSAHRNGRHEQ